AVLTSTNLTQANLRKANLTNANLSGANLTGAFFRYSEGWDKATWTGAYYDTEHPTVWPKDMDPTTLGITEKKPED
ncbi:MAG TPA: pentapeptide repeat-containing protein, partial [Pirellulales bacterium]|nr:pentapeptide repeat-containing protein [Pirellulales bacterium]